VPAGNFKLTIEGDDQAAANGDLDITEAVTIQGEGQGVTTLDGNSTSRVFEVRPAVTGVRIERMTVTGGFPNDDDNGDGCRGGALLSRGDVTVANTIISNNKTGKACNAHEGGGIAAISGTLSVLDSVVSNNAAASGAPLQGSQCSTSCTGLTGEKGGAGGGVWSAVGVTVARSTFTGNRAGAGGAAGGATGGDGPGDGTGGTGTGGTGGVGGDGGAIASDGGAVVIDDSTISSNRAGDGGTGGAGNGGLGGAGGSGGAGIGGAGGKGGDGGGVNSQGTLSVTRSTFSGNVGGASGKGGTGTGGRGGTGEVATTSGPGEGGSGGTAGRAGGIWAVQLTAVNTTLNGNVSGSGGSGGAGVGGSGGFTTTGVGSGGNGLPPGEGGALVLLGTGSDDKLVHLTISDNRIGSYGTGGIGTGVAGSANGATSTLERASGLYSNAPVRFQSTIVQGVAPGCRTVVNALVDGGGNVQTPGSGCPGTDGDAGLRALADNGGPVATRSPAPDGLAIDRNGSGCPPTDARGFPRPFGAACDAGAYELAPPTATTGAATGATATGSFNLRGPAGSAYFQYGITTAYGRSTKAVASGSGFGDRSLKAVLSGLPAGATAHYRLVATTPDGTAFGADRTLTAPKDKTAPRLSSLKLSRKKFKVGKKVVISFTSTEAGRGRLTFERAVGGKKVKSKAKQGKKAKTRCVATGQRVNRRQRCHAYKTVGAMSAKARKGKNKIVFRGKLGKTKLARGKYRLSLRVTDGAGNKSKAARITFTVTRH
jgi:hypothetical protein